MPGDAGLLAQRIRVHPGVLTAVVELLLVAERPMDESEIKRLLLPEMLSEVEIKLVGAEVVGWTIEAAEWFGLVKRDGENVEPTGSLDGVEPHELSKRLPTIAWKGLSGRRWGDGEAWDQRERGGDLALALGWFLAQNPWSDKLDGDSLQLAHERQMNYPPDMTDRLINPTKMSPIIRWAHFFGLGRRDPVNASLFVPDPTSAIRSILGELPESEYPANRFLTEIAKLCPFLDKGTVRKVISKSLHKGMLPWETEKGAISPTTSLAFHRLEAADVIKCETGVDAPAAHRRTLNLKEDRRSISLVRVLGQ